MNTVKTNIDVSLRAARTARTAVQVIIDELVRLDQTTSKTTQDVFIETIREAVNNRANLSDAEFREFVRISIEEM